LGLFFIKSFLRLLSWLPAGGPYWLARRLASLWMRLSPRKHQTTIRNLEMCFPDLDTDERQALIRESFVHYVAAVLEAGHNWYSPVESLRARCDEVVGQDQFDAALATGKGVMLLAPHCGAWEYLGIHLQHIPEFAILYKPPEDPRLHQALVERRKRAGGTMIPANPGAVRSLFAHLKKGGSAGVLPDQDPSKGQGRFAPFFGVPAFTGVLAPRLANKTGCHVFFGVCERLPKGRYRIHYLRADETVGGDDLDAAVAGVNRGVEQCVRIDPAQYLWSYRRFKTRPEGEPPFYQ